MRLSDAQVLFSLLYYISDICPNGCKMVLAAAGVGGAWVHMEAQPSAIEKEQFPPPVYTPLLLKITSSKGLLSKFSSLRPQR